MSVGLGKPLPHSHSHRMCSAVSSSSRHSLQELSWIFPILNRWLLSPQCPVTRSVRIFNSFLLSWRTSFVLLAEYSISLREWEFLESPSKCCFLASSSHSCNLSLKLLRPQNGSGPMNLVSEPFLASSAATGLPSLH